MKFEDIQQKARSEWERFESADTTRVLVGSGTCGRAAGAENVLQVARDYSDSASAGPIVREVGCLGLCYVEPLMELCAPDRPTVLYGAFEPEQTEELLEGYFETGDLNPESAVAVMDGASAEGIPSFEELDMIRGQTRIVLENCGRIDPENVMHYVAREGYSGLAAALQRTPEEVIEEVREAGLRGRGGAGFPTGLKWQFCREAEGEEKYLICNADEGDPGAFMDRSVIEGDPHRVLEGMLIAAYAIGATHGYVYIRAEYPLAIERLEKAIEQAEELGLLGEDVLGTGLSFDLKLKKGAGAFVCGEETALLASLEGERGHPRPRPPFPAQSGYKGNPTNINNVETLANVPAILRNGREWFRRHGTDKSPGTKTFALAGKVRHTGLIEVPLGIPLERIVNEIGGGVPEGGELKAVQTGGPSGGCIPARLMDLPVDYENLAEAGSIMGSGGMIVMDETTCMVDIARYFLEFTENESCGKCIPCRLGTAHMKNILDRIADGEGSEEDLELLREIAEQVSVASLCGLGQTAPNPVLTTMEYFPEEYQEHIRDKRCRAGVCSPLPIYEIDVEKSVSCGICMDVCPVDAIVGEGKAARYIDQAKCVQCGTCFEKCPADAIFISGQQDSEPIPETQESKK